MISHIYISVFYSLHPSLSFTLECLKRCQNAFFKRTYHNSYKKIIAFSGSKVMSWMLFCEKLANSKIDLLQNDKKNPRSLAKIATLQSSESGIRTSSSMVARACHWWFDLVYGPTQLVKFPPLYWTQQLSSCSERPTTCPALPPHSFKIPFNGIASSVHMSSK
jgi:hypothetical protein